MEMGSEMFYSHLAGTIVTRQDVAYIENVLFAVLQHFFSCILVVSAFPSLDPDILAESHCY